MEKIGLVIDQGADLSQKIIEENKIEIVPLKMDWPEIENIPGENIYQKIIEAEKRGIKGFGKTSQSSPKDFLDAYKKQLKNFEKIVCITVTSKLSGTYNSAIQGKTFLKPEGQKRIFVIDSLNISGGQALLSLRLFNLLKEGKKGIEDIKKELEKLKSKTCLRIAIRDPKWIESSGRISPTISKWIKKAQKIGIQPLLGIKKGTIKPIGIKIGVEDIVVALFKEMKVKTKKLRAQGKKIEVIITHGDDLKSAQRLKEMIEAKIKGTEVLFLNMVNDIVGSKTGPGTLVLAWVEA